MELFDTHAHYNDEKFDMDRDNVIQNIYESGVTKLVNAGYSLESSKKAIEIASAYDWMYVICGISPNDISDTKKQIDSDLCNLEKLIKSENKASKIVGIGEIGLDYYWQKDNKQMQQYAFIKQIELANSLNLPIVIHTREAVSDTIKILKEEEVLKKGIFHCCPLNKELIKDAVKLGFYISFAGPVTFKNAKGANDAVDAVPIDRILIETDSPYLSPEPYRGKRNDSTNVHLIAEKIAEIKGMAKEEIADITYKNAMRIFEIEN